jgi:GNAT superfamily N-acetyltransferase
MKCSTFSSIANSGEFEIRPIRPGEVHAAAELHFEFFGGQDVARRSFLKLGFNFLEAVFYRLNLDNPYFYALGGFWRGQLVGLQVFTTDRSKMVKVLLKKHAGEVAWHLSKVLISRPLTLYRYVLSNSLPTQRHIPSHVRRVPAALLLMLVRPEARTKSFVAGTRIWVGGALLEAMEAAMRAKGCREYWSETTEDNSFVHNLARRIGAKCVGEALRQGVPMRFILAPVRELSAKRIKERSEHQFVA